MPKQSSSDVWNIEPITDQPQSRAVQLLLAFTAWWNRHTLPLDLLIGGFEIAVAIWLFLNWTHEPMRLAVELITGLSGTFMLSRQILRCLTSKRVINV